MQAVQQASPAFAVTMLSDMVEKSERERDASRKELLKARGITTADNIEEGVWRLQTNDSGKTTRFFKGLFECACTPRYAREWMLLRFIKLLPKEETTPMHIVSFGAGGLFFERCLLQDLADRGVSAVKFDVVDRTFPTEDSLAYDLEGPSFNALCKFRSIVATSFASMSIDLGVHRSIETVETDSVIALIAVDVWSSNAREVEIALGSLKPTTKVVIGQKNLFAEGEASQFPSAPFDIATWTPMESELKAEWEAERAASGHK